jgi:hypothetical protein
VFYETCDKPKSQLYTDLLPLINSGAVDPLENDKLLMQVVGLERRTARGRDSIDHAPGAHDDLANAAAGALVTAFKEPGFSAEERAYPQDPRRLCAVQQVDCVGVYPKFSVAGSRFKRLRVPRRRLDLTANSPA